MSDTHQMDLDAVSMETSPGQVIQADSEVTLHFSLSLEAGHVVDSTREREPGTFVMGDETLPPGIERLLLGLRPGEQRSFVVPPERGFGVYNEKNLQQIPQEQFNLDVPLEPGLMLHFEGPGDYALPGVVRRVMDGLVVVDFNHPLAGRTLLFEVEIIAVNAPAHAIEVKHAH
ncbi:MAG: peptidylprolyl isomerase [Gammaproteobacteria bacterium]